MRSVANKRVARDNVTSSCSSGSALSNTRPIDVAHAGRRLPRPRSMLSKFEAEHHLVADFHRMAANHVADVQLGQFVVGQVEDREALLAQIGHQRLARVVLRVGLHADEVRLAAAGSDS